MSGKIEKIATPEDDLDWIQMRRDFDAIHPETARDKMLRKINENPLVPIGCLATMGALTYGLYSFRTGNRKMSQLMMRTRIVAQGFTVAALVAGVAMAYGKKE